jgi:serine/threonine-protein phosphatase PP1 catalytic subunit
MIFTSMDHRGLPRVDHILLQLRQAESFERHTRVKLMAHDLKWLAEESINVLGADPTVLSIEAPIRVIGDLHGQFYDLLALLRLGGLPPSTSYLFLGDYVDRGQNSIETIAYLLALKMKFPQNIWVLRGNHETRDVCALYGFLHECKERYDEALFDCFIETFSYLPIAAIVSGRIFCVHGGLSPEFYDVRQLKNRKRPLDPAADRLVTDLLWSDPNPDIEGYEMSERGTSYTFGRDVVREFLDLNNFDLLCRGHQIVTDGFEFPFPGDNSTLTVFSAPNYCDEYRNKGAMLKVDGELRCSFQTINVPRVISQQKTSGTVVGARIIAKPPGHEGRSE